MSRIPARARALAVLGTIGVLLTAAAPLAHAHLAAPGPADWGLCGEPHGGGASGDDGFCSLCLVGSRTRAVPARGVACDPLTPLAGPALTTATPAHPAERGRSASRPRAPPRA